MPIDFSQFQKKKEIEPEKIVQKSIIAPEMEFQQKKKRITVKRGSITKSQLMNNIIRIHKRDQQLPKREQKIPAEKYRSIEMEFRLYESR